VLGFDNVNPYYDPALKRARLEQLEATAVRTGTSFQLIEANLEDRTAVEAAFAEHTPSNTALSIWCMPPAAACMAATQTCRFLNTRG